MFQTCPICKGSGNGGHIGLTPFDKCPTCKGERIINEATGLPPEQKLKFEKQPIDLSLLVEPSKKANNIGSAIMVAKNSIIVEAMSKAVWDRIKKNPLLSMSGDIYPNSFKLTSQDYRALKAAFDMGATEKLQIVHFLGKKFHIEVNDLKPDQDVLKFLAEILTDSKKRTQQAKEFFSKEMDALSADWEKEFKNLFPQPPLFQCCGNWDEEGKCKCDQKHEYIPGNSQKGRGTGYDSDK